MGILTAQKFWYSRLVMKRIAQRSRPITSFGIVLVAMAVLLGVLDWAPASEADPLMDLTGAVYCLPSALHPSQTLHIERASVVKRTWSPVRLHQARVKNARLISAVSLTPPVLRSLLLEAPDLNAIGACLRPTGARAPPLS
jgi:hypothetical protein